MIIIPNFFRLTIRYGYMEEILTRNLGALVFEHIRRFLIEEGVSRSIQTEGEMVNLPRLTDYTVMANLGTLLHSFDQQVIYVVGKEQMRVKKGTSLITKLAVLIFLFMKSNTETTIQRLQIEIDKVVEIGFIKEF